MGGGWVEWEGGERIWEEEEVRMGNLPLVYEDQ